MAGELPPPVPEPDPSPAGLPEGDDPLADPLLRQSDEPGRWRRWVILALVAAGVLGLATIGALIYLATRSWQQHMQAQWGAPQMAPATPAGQGPFEKVGGFKPDEGEYVQGMGGGDVDGDGEAEGVVWIGKRLSIRDPGGSEERSGDLPDFEALDGSYGMGGWGPGMAGSNVRKPLVAAMGGEPAIVVTDGDGPLVQAYRYAGELVWENKEEGSHVRCLALADLEGDGEHETLVGRSSSQGLVCLDAAGKELWRYGALSDPSWVCAGDANGDGDPEIVVGYETSKPHIIDAKGQRAGEWNTWRMECAVMAADLDADDRDEFLVGATTQPSSSAGSSGPLTQGLALISVKPDGGSAWTKSLHGGQYWFGSIAIAAGDLDGDGTGEWIATAPDGTARVYDKDGKELGRHAFGKEIQTLAALAPGERQTQAQLWVSLGEEIVILEWRDRKDDA